MNYDEPSPLHVRRLQVGTTYDTPPALAINALLEAASLVPNVLKSPRPVVHFSDYAESALLYELRVHIDNYASAPTIDSELRREIWYAFKRHGITIPFPQRDVHLYPASEEPTVLRARLVAAAGLPKSFVFELAEDSTTIGRDPANSLCIANQHVSGRHATIERREDGFLLRDLNSRLGTKVNGEKIDSVELQRGDMVEIGPVAFVFETERAPSALRGHQWMHRAPAAPRASEPTVRPSTEDEEDTAV
jgi:hypothetical protein